MESDFTVFGIAELAAICHVTGNVKNDVVYPLLHIHSLPLGSMLLDLADEVVNMAVHNRLLGLQRARAEGWV